jgi:hypothetical protein
MLLIWPNRKKSHSGCLHFVKNKTFFLLSDIDGVAENQAEYFYERMRSWSADR